MPAQQRGTKAFLYSYFSSLGIAREGPEILAAKEEAYWSIGYAAIKVVSPSTVEQGRIG